ncbi:MAG: succinate dehydrogenase assembly factor 2 [Magnetococcales bacterium]|nr:succinate dehydrogenase assembly factor 2 [Magnetococcales bacterium]
MNAPLPTGPLSPLQKQLFFQSARRSMAEVERVLARFMASELEKLDDTACEKVLTFLNHPDPDILDWLTGVTQPPATVDMEVISMLIVFRSEVSPGES